MTTVAVSGGFDPLHPGHLRMFQEARNFGDRLVVIINNDNWLRTKKGYALLPQAQRKEIVEGVRGVDEAVLTEHMLGDADMSVCRSLEKLRPDVFANGGDRTSDNVPEVVLCKKLGIRMEFNVGGGKFESSSNLVKRAIEELGVCRRPWGAYRVHGQGGNWALKTLIMSPGQATSVQTHARRDEFWMLVEGGASAIRNGVEKPLEPFEIFHVPLGAEHRLTGGPDGGIVVEVMRGIYDENDITRLVDNYGRA